MALQISGVVGLPEIEAGSDIAALVVDAAASSGGPVEDGDVVVITSKIVSKAEGRAIELADIEADWARPSLDLARHTMGVWDGATLVAGCDVYRTRRADGAVHPDHRGRGIGTALARWTQACSRGPPPSRSLMRNGSSTSSGPMTTSTMRLAKSSVASSHGVRTM